MLKIKDGKGKIIGILKDNDTEPTLNNKKNTKCSECEGTGWNFRNKKPPFPKCSLCS